MIIWRNTDRDRSDPHRPPLPHHAAYGLRDVPWYIDKSNNLCHKRYMPRRSRIDAPGALHHIIVRGIERKTIFKDDADKDNFLERLKNILTYSDTSCFAWALIPNHFHLLLACGTFLDILTSRIISAIREICHADQE